MAPADGNDAVNSPDMAANDGSAGSPQAAAMARESQCCQPFHEPVFGGSGGRRSIMHASANNAETWRPARRLQT
jgi:hypothetical protein